MISVSISDNLMTGSITSNIFKSTKLELLNLDNNKFNVTFPDVNLLSKAWLQIQGNDISGIIPPQICERGIFITANCGAGTNLKCEGGCCVCYDIFTGNEKVLPCPNKFTLDSSTDQLTAFKLDINNATDLIYFYFD